MLCPFFFGGDVFEMFVFDDEFATATTLRAIPPSNVLGKAFCGLGKLFNITFHVCNDNTKPIYCQPKKPPQISRPITNELDSKDTKKFTLVSLPCNSRLAKRLRESRTIITTCGAFIICSFQTIPVLYAQTHLLSSQCEELPLHEGAGEVVRCGGTGSDALTLDQGSLHDGPLVLAERLQTAEGHVVQAAAAEYQEFAKQGFGICHF